MLRGPFQSLSVQKKQRVMTFHTHISRVCSPQIGSQTGHLARQLAALFVHAPHAVDERREHTLQGPGVQRAHVNPGGVEHGVEHGASLRRQTDLRVLFSYLNIKTNIKGLGRKVGKYRSKREKSSS